MKRLYQISAVLIILAGSLFLFMTNMPQGVPGFEESSLKDFKLPSIPLGKYLQYIDSNVEDEQIVIDVKNSLTGKEVFHLAPENVHLVEHIKNQCTFPDPAVPRNLSAAWTAEGALGQYAQVQKILDYFGYKQGGFFMEAGAFDGEYISNTVLLEVNYGWTGLLVEPLSTSYQQLLTKHRNATTLNACFSNNNYSMQVKYTPEDHGTLSQPADESGEILQCYPLYSILLAIGNPRIDFFSLDIEGNEEAVLRTIPWDKVDIRTLLIEVAVSDTDAISQIMLDNGYKIHDYVYYVRMDGVTDIIDIMYVKE